MEQASWVFQWKAYPPARVGAHPRSYPLVAAARVFLRAGLRTPVIGSGVMENGIERPNVRVTLASKIPPEDCAQFNLGYLNLAEINVGAWKNREDEGILYVPWAGEILYRRINKGT